MGLGRGSKHRAAEKLRSEKEAEMAESDRLRRVKQAERIANKGQNTAAIQLGGDAGDDELFDVKKKKRVTKVSNVGAKLGIGKGASGLQI